MLQDIPIAEKTLGELLPERLTWSLCIHTDKGTDVWVVTGMLVQYLKSATDSIIVRDEDLNPIGTIGGKEIMENLLKNPTSSLFYGKKVEDIMEPNPVRVSKDTKYKDLIIMGSHGRSGFKKLVLGSVALEVVTKSKCKVLIVKEAKK